MSLDELDFEMKKFIFEQIHSIEELEILFLLAAQPQVSWTSESVAQELRSSPHSALRWLTYLKSQNILIESPVGSFKFQTESADINNRVAELRKLYNQKRVSLIEMIFNKPATKLQSFANAFRMKEDKKDG